MRAFGIITVLMLALSVLLHAGAVVAQDYQPIVPWPVPVTEETSIGEFLNMLFRLAITGAAALAVVMIIMGGFQYMTGDSSDAKKTGRGRIQGAVVGLILLLMSTLILYTINPGILELDILDRTGSSDTTVPPPPGQTYQDVIYNPNPTDSDLSSVIPGQTITVLDPSAFDYEESVAAYNASCEANGGVPSDPICEPGYGSGSNCILPTQHVCTPGGN